MRNKNYIIIFLSEDNFNIKKEFVKIKFLMLRLIFQGLIQPAYFTEHPVIVMPITVPQLQCDVCGNFKSCGSIAYYNFLI